MFISKDGVVINLMYCSSFNIFNSAKTEIAFWIANSNRQYIIFKYNTIGLADKVLNHIKYLYEHQGALGITILSVIDLSENKMLDLK